MLIIKHSVHSEFVDIKCDGFNDSGADLEIPKQNTTIIVSLSSRIADHAKNSREGIAMYSPVFCVKILDIESVAL